MRFLSVPVIFFVLAAHSLMAQSPSQPPTPAFDPSRAAANTLRADAAAQSLLTDQQAKVRNVLADENPFAPASPGDSDIGQQLILKRNERTEEFAIGVDSSYFFTDNAAQVNEGAQDDWFYVGGVSLSWQPRLSKRFYGDLSLGQHWYRYDEFNVLDYEAGDGAAGIIVLMPEVWNTLWHVHYYYQRITQGIDDSPVYETHNLRAGVQKTVLFDRKNTLNLSLLASIALEASPSELERNEYSASVGWNYKITHRLFLGVSYRLLYYDYSNFEGREDWNHNFGAALVYRPWEWMELAGSWNYTLNRSNKEPFSYDTQLAGPSVSVRMKF